MNSTQSELQKDNLGNNKNNSSNQKLFSKPYHRRNSRSLENALLKESSTQLSDNLIPMNENDNSNKNSSVNDFLKVSRTAQAMFRS